jgi:hypothetical protein
MIAASRVARTHLAWLLIPIALFVVLRLPPLLHQPGGQDEQFFSVPGLLVWQEGIPRIPYLPTTNRMTFFAGADKCLMALPPGLFYCQAIFYAIFPAGYPTSRLPLFVAGLIAIVLTYRFALLLGANRLGALLAAGLIAISRPMLFTAITARPDLLCCICGMAVTLFLLNHKDDITYRRVVCVGVFNGLGILFHPFALVFCLQSAVYIFCIRGLFWKSTLRVVILTAVTLVVASAWFLLIWQYPEEFKSQFFSNVVDRAGPGIHARLLWPFPSLQRHAVLLYEFAGIWQCGLMLVGLVGGSLFMWLKRDQFCWQRVVWVWTSIYLTATVAGIHPTKGYWAYPAMLCFAMLGYAVNQTVKHFCDTSNNRRANLTWSMIAIVVGLLMLPGAGLKSSWLFILHWNEPEYHGTKFINGVLNELPKEGVFLADLCYVFDVYLSGRNTLLAQNQMQYWGTNELPYSYLMLSWEGRDNAWQVDYHGRLLTNYGDSSVPQKCFVDVYAGSLVNK